MILDDRVARHVQHVTVLIVFEALGSQRHTLIQTHMVADNRGLTDHHARTVVYREIFAYLSSRVDIDTRL